MKKVIIITIVLLSQNLFAQIPYDTEGETYGPAWSGPDISVFTKVALTPQQENQRWRCIDGIGLKESIQISSVTHPFAHDPTILEFRGDLINAQVSSVQLVGKDSTGSESRSSEYELRIVGNAAKARQFIVINRNRELGALEKAASIDILWGQGIILVDSLSGKAVMYSIHKHCKKL